MVSGIETTAMATAAEHVVVGILGNHARHQLCNVRQPSGTTKIMVICGEVISRQDGSVGGGKGDFGSLLAGWTSARQRQSSAF